MFSLIHSHLPFSFSSFRISSNKTHFSPSRLVSLLLLHFTYAYLCFYFHPKIVSNRSVDHDPSEVPHMLFDIKTTLNHMERLKAGTNTAIIIEKFSKNIWNKFIQDNKLTTNTSFCPLTKRSQSQNRSYCKSCFRIGIGT